MANDSFVFKSENSKNLKIGNFNSKHKNESSDTSEDVPLTISSQGKTVTFDEFKKLQSIVCVHSKRTVGEKTSEERRYYISSIPPDPKRQGGAIRSHWGIENRVHWILDVAFDEDKLKAKTGHIAENLAVIRHIVVNLLKNDKATKGSIAKKRFKAALNEGYFLEVLKGFFSFGQQR